MMSRGKHLADLAHEVETLCLPVTTILRRDSSNNVCIAMRGDGTLTCYSWHDGMPGYYSLRPRDERCGIVPLADFIKFLQANCAPVDEFLRDALDASVWRVTKPRETIAAFVPQAEQTFTLLLASAFRDPIREFSSRL